MEGYNFGAKSNGKVCVCGRHHGCGKWTPETRAAFMKRMSEKLPAVMRDHQRAYLTSWQHWHGPVVYHIAKLGVLKNKDIYGPVFGPAPIPASGGPDLFQGRADIYG